VNQKGCPRQPSVGIIELFYITSYAGVPVGDDVRGAACDT